MIEIEHLNFELTLKETIWVSDLKLISFIQLASLDEEVSNLKDSVIFLEKRTSFRFELPNGRSVGIKANPSKSCFQVLEPVMKKNGFDIGDYSIHFVSFHTIIFDLVFFFIYLFIFILFFNNIQICVK